jgi:hypothetical protein
MTPTLTPDAPPEAVLAMAHILARTRTTWGAIETEDFVGAACLAFYTKRDYVTATARNFHNLMVAVMDTAMREQARKEAKEKGLDLPTLGLPIVQDLASHARKFAGGHSASPLTEFARHRRRVAQREYNRTYYYRHVGLQHCVTCGVMVNRGGHGARFCRLHAPIRYPRLCLSCGGPLGMGRNRTPGYCRPCGYAQKGTKVA